MFVKSDWAFGGHSSIYSYTGFGVIVHDTEFALLRVARFDAKGEILTCKDLNPNQIDEALKHAADMGLKFSDLDLNCFKDHLKEYLSHDYPHPST